ncbi:hypothetical protein [Nocardioides mangrovi]|uniref:Uncharacterized protein n=1 Tax=Nocardioides mangrovi TaxID=2874580 RepID=A0ABS7UET6_9ACTN|nr:hypothetical protein [Nocardioides mangrovi]MBZ5739206.1 hypothetical protein [Nocardioides mangrovi]
MTSLDTLIALAVPAALLIAYAATATASPRSLRREAARRADRVHRHPALATLGDVQLRLDAELPAGHAGFVFERVATQRIDARTLWVFLDRFGAEALVLTLAAGHGYAGLLRMLRDEATYDAAEARVLAGLSEPWLFDLATI